MNSASCLDLIKWAISCNTMYSKLSIGFLVNSLLSLMLFERGVAASPSGFHFLNEQSLDFHTYEGFKSRDCRCCLVPQLGAIPGIDDLLLFFFARIGANL